MAVAGFCPLVVGRQVMGVVATAADLGSDGDDWFQGGIGGVAGMGTSRAMATLALYTREMGRGLFALETEGVTITGGMTGKAASVVVLVDGFEPVKGVAVRGCLPAGVSLWMAIHASGGAHIVRMTALNAKEGVFPVQANGGTAPACLEHVLPVVVRAEGGAFFKVVWSLETEPFQDGGIGFRLEARDGRPRIQPPPGEAGGFVHLIGVFRGQAARRGNQEEDQERHDMSSRDQPVRFHGMSWMG